jgi:hypothetical protein
MSRSFDLSIIQALAIAIQHLAFVNNAEICAEGHLLRVVVPCGLFHADHQCFGAAHTRLPLGPLLHASTITASNLAIMLCTGPQADFPVRDVYVAVAQRGVS